MRRVNIAAPDFDYDADDPEGFRSGQFRFGGEVGAQRLGTTVYELPPGQAICPYHYEYTQETVRVLMFSEVTFPTVTVYPDSDKVGVYTSAERGDDLIVPRSAGVPYFRGEG